MTKYQCTVPRHRLLVEILDYAPTTTNKEVYLNLLQEDFNAMLSPAAMEVVSVVEMDLGEVKPKVEPEAPMACLPAEEEPVKPVTLAGFLPLEAIGRAQAIKEFGEEAFGVDEGGNPVG